MACESPAAARTLNYAPLPVGSVERGEALFHQPSIGQAPGCGNCHETTVGMRSFGPTLPSMVQQTLQEGRWVAGGDSAEIFLRQAILDPRAEIADGFPPMMFDSYGDHLTEQQLADLIAYILSLKESTTDGYNHESDDT